jgi:hypothetical protein
MSHVSNLADLGNDVIDNKRNVVLKMQNTLPWHYRKMKEEVMQMKVKNIL